MSRGTSDVSTRSTTAPRARITPTGEGRDDTDAPDGLSPASPRPEERRQRLVVELSTIAAEGLQYLTDLEELNKTTIVNRALQVYAILRRAEAQGGQILIQESKDGPTQRVRFL